MMRKAFRVCVTISVCALFASFIAFALLRGTEPEYGGQTLSDWLDVLGDHYMDQPDDKERAQAEDAIRRIGTKGIPYLLKWIRSDPPKQGIFYRMGCAVIVHLHLSWQFPQDKHWRREFMAPRALGLLGSDAEPTVPELAKLLHDTNRPRNAKGAATALMRLGDAGLPALLSILTNRSADLELRSYIALEWPSTVNPVTTTPTMERLLADPDSTVRQCATNALREIYPRAFAQDGTLHIEKSWAIH